MANNDISISALFELIRLGIGTSSKTFDFTCLTDEEWRAVVRESKAQAVGLMCFDSEEKAYGHLPKDIYEDWFAYSARVLYNNALVGNVQNKIVYFFKKKNIPYKVLKGLSAATYYPQPDKRALGDIDILPDAEYFEDAKKALLEYGCKLENDFADFHHTFISEGIPVEVHYDISGTPDGVAGDIVREFFRESTKKIYSVDNCESFCSFDDAGMGAVMLLHILHHIMSEGIGLRQICDWACFVNKTGNEAFWNERLIPMLKKAGLFKFCCAVTQVTIEYLGIDSPNWLSPVDKDVPELLLKEILRAGNFGRKDKHLSGTGMMFTKDSQKQTVIRKMKAMLYALNKTNKIVYPILNKLPWLYPVIMVWRVLRYIVLRILGKRQSLSKASRYADDKYDLVSRFDLYQIDK